MSASVIPGFKEFITNLLIKADLSEYLDKLTDEQSMLEFEKAFTSSSVQKIFNYEKYENLGDVSLNKTVVGFCYDEFDLMEIRGNVVNIVTNFKSRYADKRACSEMAYFLKFGPYIQASSMEWSEALLPLHENVFEAFIGCLEALFDMRIQKEGGFNIVKHFIRKILKERYGEEFKKYKELLKSPDGIDALREELADPIMLIKEFCGNGSKHKIDYSENKISVEYLSLLPGYYVSFHPVSIQQTINTGKIYRAKATLRDVVNRTEITAIGEGYDPPEAKRNSAKQIVEKLKANGMLSIKRKQRLGKIKRTQVHWDIHRKIEGQEVGIGESDED